MNPPTRTSADSGCQNSVVEDVRTGLTVESLKRALADNLFYAQGKFPAIATKNDFYMALAYTVRDHQLHRWINTIETYLKQKELKVVCYLSAEFLLGPRLANSLVDLGIYAEVRQAVEELGLNLSELIEQEAEPGLGNGGLGRLAACYMDSLSTLKFPPSATAFATNLASLARRFGMGGRLKLRTNGYAWVTPGNWLVQRHP